MKALLLANGDAPGVAFLQELARQHDLLIAIDGGARAAALCGFAPHIVCGDFDSVDMAWAKASLPAAQFVALPDQNLTDLEKALQLAMARGAGEVTITGAWGGRIDHALAGIAVLLAYHSELKLRIAEEGFDLFVVSGALEFPTTPGNTISLLALGVGCQVTIADVKWPLDNEVLAVGTRGISNVALGDSVRVEAKGGPLIVCRLRLSLREA